jgi:DnaJ-class molecular chaperone
VDVSEYTSDFIDMICPKCSGSGKQGKKEACDLCAGQCWISLERYEEYMAKVQEEGEE